MKQRNSKYVGLTPPPTSGHLAWAVGLFVGITLGAAAGGFSFGFIAKALNASVIPFISFGVVAGSAFTGGAVFYLGFLRKYEWGWRELGFVRAKHSLWHVLWWIPLTITVGGIGAMLIGTSLGLDPSSSGSSSDGFELGIAAGVTIFLGTAIVLPFFEELVFRRILMDWINTALPVWLAATAATLIFTVAHINPVLMMYVFFLGVSLILAKLWFRSLWAPLLIHSANNAIVSLVALSAL